MPDALSRDLRERFVRAFEKGSSIPRAALSSEVSPSVAVKLMRGVREREPQEIYVNGELAAPDAIRK